MHEHVDYSNPDGMVWARARPDILFAYAYAYKAVLVSESSPSFNRSKAFWPLFGVVRTRAPEIYWQAQCARNVNMSIIDGRQDPFFSQIPSS